MKGKINVRTVVLVVLAILTLAFAYFNYVNKVQVWPFRGFYPLTLVIALSFGLGVGIGALGQNILSAFRSRSGRILEGTQGAQGTPGIRAGEREHPGRP